MSDTQRLERAWKLHQRSQNDDGAEAENAAALRDRILEEEGVSLEKLVQRFEESTVPPTGRPRSGGNPYSGFHGFASAFGGGGWAFAGGFDPNMQDAMNRAAEEMKRRKRQAEQQEFERQRQRYTAQFSQSICELFENLVNTYGRKGVDLQLLKTLIECMQDTNRCEAQLGSMAERLDNGELTSRSAQQQAFRALIRSSRKQNETLNKLFPILLAMVGSGFVQAAAEKFGDKLGRRPQ